MTNGQVMLNPGTGDIFIWRHAEDEWSYTIVEGADGPLSAGEYFGIADKLIFIGDFDMDDYWETLPDGEIKKRIDRIFAYCDNDLDKMWAATVVATLLDGDFRDAKKMLTEYRRLSYKKDV